MAVVIAATACEDVSFPGSSTVSGADLIVLGLTEGAPSPTTSTFWVSNNAALTRTLRHADPFNTLYLQLSFPAGSFESLNGQPLDDTDSVEVTVQPLAGGYGFTLSPSGLQFAGGNEPVAVFSFGRYADPSVAGSDPTYPSETSYLDALDVWQEVGVDRWQVAPGSGPGGADEVRAQVDASGRYRLAARR